MAEAHESTLTVGQEPAYKNWSTLAGYFDGDGTVEFSVDESKIEIRLAFDDNWKPFLEGIRAFLLARGVTPGRFRQKEQSRTYHVVIAGIPSGILMAKRMLPHVVKKKQELVAVVDYLQGRSTGREFVDVMNEEVSQGQRTGKLRPYAPATKRKRYRRALAHPRAGPRADSGQTASITNSRSLSNERR